MQPPRLQAPRTGARHRGVTVVEVLCAILLFTIGVLGLVKLQARASTAAVDAEDRSRAALMAEELISTMWLRKTASLDSATLTAWETRLSDTSAQGLPGSPSYSVTTASGVTSVTITWQEPSRVQAASAVTSRYTTQVAIP